MEGSSSQLSAANPSSSGASKFLADLPSQGLFSSPVISPNPGGMRVYLCDHNTSPPEHQHIKTNQQNILIRSLTLKKQKGDSSSRDGAEGSRKRAEKVLEGRSAKRTNNQMNSRQEGSTSQASNRDLQSLTVERLRSLLKAKGLSPKGKKDELIARLKDANT